MVKAKVKAKSHILGAFRSVGKKMAGFKGDVAVDGTAKKVSVIEWQPSADGVDWNQDRPRLVSWQCQGPRRDVLYVPHALGGPS